MLTPMMVGVEVEGAVALVMELVVLLVVKVGVVVVVEVETEVVVVVVAGVDSIPHLTLGFELQESDAAPYMHPCIASHRSSDVAPSRKSCVATHSSVVAHGGAVGGAGMHESHITGHVFFASLPTNVLLHKADSTQVGGSTAPLQRRVVLCNAKECIVAHV